MIYSQNQQNTSFQSKHFFCKLTPYLKKLVFLTSFLSFPVVHAGEIEEGFRVLKKANMKRPLSFLRQMRHRKSGSSIPSWTGSLERLGRSGKSAYVASLWFEKSASQNHIPAQYELGILYSKERHNFGRDLEKSHYWMELAAKNGDPNAQYETGKWYEKKYLRTDIELGKAIKWYRLAAGNGQSDAQGKLGRFP